MSVIGLVPSPESAAGVVDWTLAFAGEGEETAFLCLEPGLDGRTAHAVREALNDKGKDAPQLVAIDDPAPVTAVLTHARKRNARLLVTARFELPAPEETPQTSDELIRSSPCQTFLPLYGEKTPAQIAKILFVMTTGSHNRAVLDLVETLRKESGAQVTIGQVEDETGAAPGLAGASSIRAILHDATLNVDDFEIKVVVDRLKHRGIATLFEDHDLVMTGWDNARYASPLRQSLGESTVAVVKRSPPLRIRSVAGWLPRINPADHADLLFNLRQGSSWGPDFIAMLGLASAIASLGLLQDSPAVVIGSMLLAPLMTPMIGLGLALGQANVSLMRRCGKSIGLGFLLTLLVSILMGLITPAGETLPQEVLARGGPNVLDLLIAVFAAAAATFAMARPNISGAIAGVAIATALVPPVCALGISLADGAVPNALGAATLFFTNLVAIIVTSSFTFTILGVTALSALPRYRRMAAIGRWALVATLLALAGPLSAVLISQIDRGKLVPASYPVTRAVANALNERVDQDEGVEIMFMARSRSAPGVLIQIASQEETPPTYADELREIVRDRMGDPELPVIVVAVRGLWRSDADEPQTGSR